MDIATMPWYGGAAARCAVECARFPAREKEDTRMKTFGRMLCIVALVTMVVVGSASPASAGPDFGVAAGATEVIGSPMPTHLALYPAVGAYAAFATEHVTFMPQLMVEFAPEIGYWGFMPMLVADVPVSDHVGLDAIVGGYNDQEETDFGGAAIFVGGGFGCSYFFDEHWTLSPSVTVYRGVRTVSDTLFSPAAFVSYTFK